MTEGIAPTAIWQTRKLLVVGLATAAVAAAIGVGYALAPGAETFRDSASLVARLGELGAPCGDFKAIPTDPDEGICRRDGRAFVLVTDPARAAKDIGRWRNGTFELDGKAVAAGDGWYVFGERTYVARVADLLGADLIS